MKTYAFTINAPRGLHAQPCAALAAVASKSSCDVFIEHNGADINVADPIKLMSALITCGERIIIKVSGDDEEEIFHQLKQIIDSQLL
jgi:phosphocarrier protein HPr